MRRTTLVGLIVALALLATSMLTGCGLIAQKATEAAVEKSTGVKVDAQNQTVTTTDDEGNTTELSAKEGAYPEGFPADFPQYAGATVASALKGTTNGEDSFTVILKTVDAPKDAYEWYLEEFDRAGWTVEQKMDGTTSDAAFATISVAKGDLKGAVTLNRGNDETETSIMVGLNPKEK